MDRLGFIGLGVMGAPMAGHLSAAGYPVAVYNRSPAKISSWLNAHKGRQASSPIDAAKDASVVFTCVGNDDDLRQVVLGNDGVLSAMAAGSCLVDHTTASADIAREIAQAALERDVHFVDAPVSGGEAGAINGSLTVMCGGREESFARVREVIMSYAKACTLMGPSGSGQLTKMVNQICVAGVLQGLSEGLHFGQQAGLDMRKVLDVIGQGAAQSWQLDNRGQSMCEGRYDFGFAVDWMRKDLAIVIEEASRLGLSLDSTNRIDQAYAGVQALGGQRWDTSSLIEYLRRPSNNDA